MINSALPKEDLKNGRVYTCASEILREACDPFLIRFTREIRKPPTLTSVTVSRPTSCLLLFDEPRENRAQSRDKRGTLR